MLRVFCWYWTQNPNRAGYDAEKVNRWAEGIRRHLTLPHSLAVVTDEPEGIDSSIDIIPLPHDFDGLHVHQWSERNGLPQCYRRLRLFAPDAGAYFGAEHLVSMDLDMLAFSNLDHLFEAMPDFRMFAGTSKTRPYNGSMVQIRAGARPQVWEQFLADPVGVATKARDMHVGSDQAVISMILGPGEQTWTERDGVYHYGQRFNITHARGAPRNLAMLFFPGATKPWDRTARKLPYVDAAWDGRLVPPVGASGRVRLRAYKDRKGWGDAFAAAARQSGRFCSMFHRAAAAQTGAAFVRLDQQGSERDHSRNIVAKLAARGIITLPTAREALWYDDKGAQLEVLRPWMPETAYLTSFEAAAVLAERAAFPLVSKSIDGSGSKGVRLLHTPEEAIAEAREAFGPGLPSVYGRRQQDYIYWQQFVPDQACDYRVVVVGPYVYGLVREVRKGDFRASGSGSHRVMRMTTRRERAAAALGVEIAEAIGTQWMAFDIVFSPEERPLVLEMSSAWTMPAYRDALCFTRQLAPTRRTGADSFGIAVEILERMAG